MADYLANYLSANKPKSIFEVLSDAAKMRQEWAKGAHAEEQQQQNAERLKALIAEKLLENQAAGLKMPYVAPKEAANLRDVLAQAKQRETETQYIPTKYSQAAERLGLGRENLELQKLIHSPEQLQALLELRKAQTQSAPARALTAEGKSILEQENLRRGLLPSGQIGNEANISPERLQELSNSYELQRIKRNTDTALRKAFPQIESIDKTLESVPVKEVSQFYGPAGQARAAAEYAKSFSGKKPSKEYQEYRNFLTTKGPSLVGQMRQFLQDSVTPGAQEHLRSIIFPKKWSSNPELALQQFNALKEIYDIEKAARVRAANDPSIYKGLSSKQKKSVDKFSSFMSGGKAEYKPPVFNTKEEFESWKQSATPFEVQQYKQYLHG